MSKNDTILDKVLSKVKCENCTKPLCVCQILKNKKEHSDKSINSCQKCQQENLYEEIVDAFLAMSDEDFDKYRENATPTELLFIGQGILSVDVNRSATFINKMEQSISRALGDAKDFFEEVSNIEPFNGLCGSRNPYEYGSTKYFIQEWVGTSETWEQASFKSSNGKMDKSVPKEFHDNMTAAEHYIFGKAIFNDDDPAILSQVVKHGYRLTGSLGWLYQPAKGLARNSGISRFKNASAPSLNQAVWESKAWSHPFTESVVSQLQNDDFTILTKLGECVTETKKAKNEEK